MAGSLWIGNFLHSRMPWMPWICELIKLWERARGKGGVRQWREGRDGLCSALLSALHCTASPNSLRLDSCASSPGTRWGWVPLCCIGPKSSRLYCGGPLLRSAATHLPVLCSALSVSRLPACLQSRPALAHEILVEVFCSVWYFTLSRILWMVHMIHCIYTYNSLSGKPVCCWFVQPVITCVCVSIGPVMLVVFFAMW